MTAAPLSRTKEDFSYDRLPYLEVSVANLAGGVTTSATVAFNTLVTEGSDSTSYDFVSVGS